METSHRYDDRLLVTGVRVDELGELTSEQLEIIRGGAAPLEPSDRGDYFDHVAALLRERDAWPSNRAVSDIVQAVQRVFKRALSRTRAGLA
jgi:hypothetical protein